LFGTLFDQMEEKDVQEALDLVDLVVPAHFLHLSDQGQGLGVTSLFDVGPQF
jgi:hypothetical protein